MKIFKLLKYAGILTVRTFYAFFLSCIYLNKQKYPSSVFFNLALILPVFFDYQDLQGLKFQGSVEQSIKTSALMLLEDILLDDENITIKDLQNMFTSPTSFQAKSNSEKLTKNLAINLWFVLSEKHIGLLKDLNQAQIEATRNDNFKDFYQASYNKGLWYPALAYSFNPKMNSAEIETLTLLGFWIKCVDDLVDIDEDRDSQTTTIYTHLETDLIANAHLDKLRLEVFNKISKLDYSDKKIKLFLYRTSISVCTFKLYSEFRKKLPAWYSKLSDKFLPFQVINLLLASLIGLPSLIKID